MESTFWERVVADGRVPSDRPLAELTTELTSMLGSPDPALRDRIAYATLATWVSEGVYDDLLGGLGDGMAAGLVVHLGESGTDSVFRRSFSALVLTECIKRDNVVHAVGHDTVLGWGDRIMGWYVREQDLRGFVPGKGWAHSVAHGADALAALAKSESLGRLELTVVLDVIADRLVAPTYARLTHGEDDRMALATMTILRRDLLPMDVLDPWLARVVEGGGTRPAGDLDPFLVTGNIQGYLRSLHVQLALAAQPPACRADLLLSVIAGLKRLNPALLA